MKFINSTLSPFAVPMTPTKSLDKDMGLPKPTTASVDKAQLKIFMLDGSGANADDSASTSSTVSTTTSYSSSASAAPSAASNSNCSSNYTSASISVSASTASRIPSSPTVIEFVPKTPTQLPAPTINLHRAYFTTGPGYNGGNAYAGGHNYYSSSKPRYNDYSPAAACPSSYTRYLRSSLPSPSRCVALDCEMVGVDGGLSAVARVTLVDGYGEVLMDDFVLPESPVVDYRTHITGITAQDLVPSNCRSLADVRRCVVALLTTDAYTHRHHHQPYMARPHASYKLLVGHGLVNDLKLLGIEHPPSYVRDTAKYASYQKTRPGFGGMLWPRKLRDLSIEFLGIDIQPADEPHCPLKDAQAALRLYQRVQLEWERCQPAQPILSPYERHMAKGASASSSTLLSWPKPLNLDDDDEDEQE